MSNSCSWLDGLFISFVNTWVIGCRQSSTDLNITEHPFRCVTKNVFTDCGVRSSFLRSNSTKKIPNDRRIHTQTLKLYRRPPVLQFKVSAFWSLHFDSLSQTHIIIEKTACELYITHSTHVWSAYSGWERTLFDRRFEMTEYAMGSGCIQVHGIHILNECPRIHLSKGKVPLDYWIYQCTSPRCFRRIS